MAVPDAMPASALLRRIPIVRKFIELARLAEVHPEEPWLWRPDWASGRIHPTAPDGAVAACVWAAVAPGLLLMLVFTEYGLDWAQIPEKHGTLEIAVPLAICAGLGLRAALRWQRWRTSRAVVFELASTPAPIGGCLEGVLHVPGRERTPMQVSLHLECVRLTVTKVGDGSTTKTEHLFAADSTPAASQLGVGPLGTTIPVQFSIPAKSEPSSPVRSGSRTIWSLTVRAERKGTDVYATYEVPVFDQSGL